MLGMIWGFNATTKKVKKMTNSKGWTTNVSNDA